MYRLNARAGCAEAHPRPPRFATLWTWASAVRTAGSAAGSVEWVTAGVAPTNVQRCALRPIELEPRAGGGGRPSQLLRCLQR
ncbi:hypothetical protein PF008_g24566, partial [Phytophthora fragariae]